ncbi:hypothetical protein [Thalassospira marina]|uniref:Uncharacterized protein n=1 Tax=Thalassospira marina TaxID=2048283 RepID=A0A2N3KUC1_9PROT|nr:hypothetical protein [Thalassospira marina]AUG54234.1 hypothetical protein CSC3H3_17045 [Thalassospira marina]PKR54151.1 hypothetical protein COO20_11490 [Thalassospira marina]
MVGSIGSGLSSAQQALSDRITPQRADGAPLSSAGASMKKAEGLMESIASIVTDYQPLETSGHRGTRVNIVT